MQTKPGKITPAWSHVIWRKAASLLLRRSAALKNRFIQLRLQQLGLGHAREISTHMAPSEMIALYDLACRLPAKAQAVEIGSYLGASTCYIVAGMADGGGRLCCIDTWGNETMPEGPRDTFAMFQTNLAPAIDFITIMRKRSDELLESDVPARLDFAFIDADHSYAAVKKDFERLADRMSQQGIIAFHDCYWFSDVSRVVGEALSCGRWVLGGFVENFCWIQRSPAGQLTGRALNFSVDDH